MKLTPNAAATITAEIHKLALVWETTEVDERTVVTHLPLEVYPFDGCWQTLLIWVCTPSLIRSEGSVDQPCCHRLGAGYEFRISGSAPDLLHQSFLTRPQGIHMPAGI